MSADEAFSITDEHLTLLAKMCVGWQDCEYGAPEINPKRPYGNSDVSADIHRLLGWSMGEDGEQVDDARAGFIHREMENVLQIVLENVGQDVRGEWVRRFYGHWQRVETSR